MLPPLQAVMAVITGVSRRKAHSSLAAVRSSSHTDAADASPRRRCPGGGKWPPFMTPRRKNQYFRPNLFVPQQLTPKAYQIHGKPVPGTPWWREIRIAQYFPNGGSTYLLVPPSLRGGGNPRVNHFRSLPARYSTPTKQFSSTPAKRGCRTPRPAVRNVHTKPGL